MKRPLSILAPVLLLASCTSTSYSPEEPVTPDGKAGMINIQIIANDFTRAETEDGLQEESDISSLDLAFYHVDSFVGIASATKKDGVWSAEVPSYPGQHPDRVIAYANLSDTDKGKINVEFGNVRDLVLQNLSASGKFVMTTSSHNNGGTYYYTPISESDYADGASPVQIRLERVAAKVTASLAASPVLNPVVMKKAATSEARTLNLTIDSWGLMAVENRSWLIKRLGDTSQLSGTWWDDSRNGTVHWAQSYSYSNDVFPKVGDKAGTVYKLTYPRYSEIANSFPSKAYQHESTLPAAHYDKDNAVASIVIAGHYTIDDSAQPATFYHYGDGIYTEDELWAVFAEDQNVLFTDNGARPSADQLKGVATISKVAGKASNIYTLTIKADATLSAYKGHDGNAITSSPADLNSSLSASIGNAEKFIDGKCYFIVPIRHLNYEEGATAQRLGAYGIVRNHHYNLTVRSISGLGTGVGALNDLVLDWRYSETMPEYQVNMEITVNKWALLNQDIDIVY